VAYCLWGRKAFAWPGENCSHVSIILMNLRRGLFRLWLVVSVVWALVSVATMWQEFTSPYFEESKYVYLPEGAPTPKGVDEFSLLPRADADQERADTIFGNGQAIGHIRKIDTDDRITDDGYVAIAFPNNLKLWAPKSLDLTERGKLLDAFMANCLAPRNAELWHRRFWQLGIVVVPPAIAFLLGAAQIWAFSGFRAGSR